jgi:hypothetical protein
MNGRTGIEKSLPQRRFAQSDNDPKVRADSDTGCVVCNLGRVKVCSYYRAQYSRGIRDAYTGAEASIVDLLKGEQLCR